MRTGGVRRSFMFCDCLPSRLASLTCLFHFHGYSFLPFVIPLKVGNLLLSRTPYVFGYYVRVFTL